MNENLKRLKSLLVEEEEDWVDADAEDLDDEEDEDDEEDDEDS